MKKYGVLVVAAIGLMLVIVVAAYAGSQRYYTEFGAEQSLTVLTSMENGQPANIFILPKLSMIAISWCILLHGNVIPSSSSLST